MHRSSECDEQLIKRKLPLFRPILGWPTQQIMQITYICIAMSAAWKEQQSNIKLTNLIRTTHNATHSLVSAWCLFRWFSYRLTMIFQNWYRERRQKNETKRERRKDSAQHLPSSKLMAKKIKSVEWLCFKCLQPSSQSQWHKWVKARTQAL